jgi:hypothetical protein
MKSGQFDEIEPLRTIPPLSVDFYLLVLFHKSHNAAHSLSLRQFELIARRQHERQLLLHVTLFDGSALLASQLVKQRKRLIVTVTVVKRPALLRRLLRR